MLRVSIRQGASPWFHDMNVSLLLQMNSRASLLLRADGLSICDRCTHQHRTGSHPRFLPNDRVGYSRAGPNYCSVKKH